MLMVIVMVFGELVMVVFVFEFIEMLYVVVLVLGLLFGVVWFCFGLVGLLLEYVVSIVMVVINMRRILDCLYMGIFCREFRSLGDDVRKFGVDFDCEVCWVGVNFVV